MKKKPPQLWCLLALPHSADSAQAETLFELSMSSQVFPGPGHTAVYALWQNYGLKGSPQKDVFVKTWYWTWALGNTAQM